MTRTTVQEKSECLPGKAGGLLRLIIFVFQNILTKAVFCLKGFNHLAFSEDGRHNYGQYPGGEGSLSLEKIWQAADDPLEATLYLASPVAMINVLKAGLTVRGIRPNRIRIDEWDK